MKDATSLPRKRFYAELLNAPMVNHNYCWGSFDAVENRLFLTCWDDEYSDDESSIFIFNPNSSNPTRGYAERKRHLEQMHSGTPAYGVIVEKKSRRPTGELLEFDGTQIIDGKLYAKIARRITVRDLGSRSTDRRASTLVEDIRACEELAIKNSVSSPAANNKLKEICGLPNVLATGVRERDVIALLSWLIELKKPRGGFYTCINANLPECTAEAVVMRHTPKFRDSDVKKCRGRLASHCPDYLNELESGSSQLKHESTLPDLIRSMGVELSADFKVQFARDSKSSAWRPLQRYLDDLASFEDGQAQQSKKNFPIGGHVVSLINIDSSTRWLFVGVYAVNAVVPEKLEYSNFTYSMNRIAGLEHLEARVIVTCDLEGRNSYRTGQRIEDRLNVESIRNTPVRPSAPGRLAAELGQILDGEEPTTTRKTLIDARVGQGQFREDVLGLWNGQCAVTGVSLKFAVRASHIKPWCDCDPKERLDPENGLPLVGTLDLLFDSGFITFEGDGQIIVSSIISDEEARALNINNLGGLRRVPSPTMAEYLKWHQGEVFIKARFGSLSVR